MSETRDRKTVVEVCSDCDAGGVSRRRFLGRVGGAMAAAAAGPLWIPRAPVLGADAKPPETLVKLLYESLKPEQKKVMHFPFDHELRSKISNNWDVVDKEVASIGKFYNADQQELIRQIFRGITTEDGYERFQKQMKDDAGGFDKYTCAIFGRPGEEKFEFLLTGRHTTLRVDGNSVDNAAFGGPIFYGHAVTFNEQPDHPGNVWWHQAKLANEVYRALDGKQREVALINTDPPDADTTVVLKGHGGNIPGLRGADMSRDQKELLEKTLKSLLSMFRESDVNEALECIKRNGGLDTLRVSFYKEGDLGEDQTWDRWRVEGPTFVWYFRGSPHVHTWVNLAHHVGGDAAPRTRV